MQLKKHYLLSAIFLIIQLITIIRNIGTEYIYFFWLCDFAPFLFMIFFLFKKYDLVKALVNITLIPQWIYLLDLIYGSFSQNFIFIDNISYINVFYLFSSTITHLSSSLALIFTIKVKSNKIQLKHSFILLLAIYAFTLIFTSPDYYVNFVYSQNIIPFTIPFHTYIWPISAFILVVLPGQLIQYLFYKKSK